MILHSLEIHNFRILREVHVTFGRGLNVLFGPNDLGKSSLVEALRAAFLLPVTSAQNREFLPWGTDQVPRVVVVFAVNETVWKITKEFGTGARASACLERVGESGTLFPEAQGRGVEGRIREILAWGIPGPGGKGAPRGLPESYLTTALLGRQDQVSAILEASFQDDGVDSGLQLVTSALGALGQDPLVGKLVQRLEERVADVFTPAGKVKANGPLAEHSHQINDQENCLEDLGDRIRESEEIERKVQSLTEQKHRISEDCSRLQEHLALLLAVRAANEELEKVRTHNEVIEEARRALALVEAEIEEKEKKHEQADAAVRKVDVELRAAREHLAKASGTREEVLKNAENEQNARRAELIAKQDAAAGREQSAQEVIHVRGQAECRAHELTLAEEAYQQGLRAKSRAQDLAEFAEIAVQFQQGNEAIEAWKASQKERDDIAENVGGLEQTLKKTEIALEEAERIVLAKKDALAAAEHAAAEGRVRREGLRLTLIRAEAAEQEALQAIARAKGMIMSFQRLAEAENLLAELGSHEQELEAKLSANSSEREACESVQTLKPLPVRPVLVAAVLGAAIIAALGVGLRFDAFVTTAACAGCALVVSGVTIVVLRIRQRKEAIQASDRQMDHLLKVRQSILEEQNQTVLKRGVAQLRVDSARSERDQAIERTPDPQALLQGAGLRLQEARGEQDKIGKELETLDNRQPDDAIATAAQVEAAARTVLLIKDRVKEAKRLYDEAHHRLAEAQIRVDAAKCAAVSVDLTGLQRRLKDARMKVGEDSVPQPEDAQTRLRVASQKAVEVEMAMQLAKGRLSDEQSRVAAVLAKLEQPPEQALAQATRERQDAEAALQSLDESSSAKGEAVESQFREAREGVSRLEEELSSARSQADEASCVHDQLQTKLQEARNRVDLLQQSMPSKTMASAEAAFEQASRQLECYSPGSSFTTENLADVESLLEQSQGQLQRTQSGLHAARGQLELVGGTVLREHRDQEWEKLEGLRKAASELELEFRAAKYLLDVLKAAEAKHAAHLGRSLARPITEMLTDLAGPRYTQVILDPTLRVRNMEVKGCGRELASLSVGTRDQLATLVRLALAAHLRSVLVLDDQLAQSDQRRLDWFRNKLHASAREHKHQIIVITCRPLDYVSREEMPEPPSCGRLEAADGLTVVDLERVASCWSDSDPY